MPAKLYQGSSLPAIAAFLTDYTGSLIDFSSGYTFEFKIYKAGGTASLVTITTGITGAAGSLASKTPNVTVAFAGSSLSAVTPDNRYRMQIKATRSADSLVRYFQDTLIVEAVAP